MIIHNDVYQPNRTYEQIKQPETSSERTKRYLREFETDLAMPKGIPQTVGHGNSIIYVT